MTTEQKIKQLEKRHAEWAAKTTEAENQYLTTKAKLDALDRRRYRCTVKCAELKRAIQNLRLRLDLPNVGSWWLYMCEPQEFVIEKVEARTDTSVILKRYRLATYKRPQRTTQCFYISSDEEGNQDAIKYLSDFKEILEEEAKRLIEIGQRCDNTPLGEIKYFKE